MTLGRYQRKLEVMASTDKLTGAANRQVFDGYFRQALDKASCCHNRRFQYSCWILTTLKK